MMEFPPKRMCKSKFREIYFAAQADLAEARRQRHRGWIESHEKRMPYLERVRRHFERGNPCDICGNVGCHCRELMYGFSADEPAIVEAAA